MNNQLQQAYKDLIELLSNRCNKEGVPDFFANSIILYTLNNCCCIVCSFKR